MVDEDRLPLSRERIAAVAVAFIDENGMTGLSMRKLGAKLGVEAMSLYNHVANKDDLLAAAGDVLLGEVLNEFVADPERSFAEDTRAIAVAFRNVAIRHPGSASLMYDQPLSSLRGLEFLQTCFEVFGKVADTDDGAALAFNVAASAISGFLRHEQTVIIALTDTAFDADDVPDELAAAVMLRDSCLTQSSDDRFDEVVEVLVAGLEARFSRS